MSLSLPLSVGAAALHERAPAKVNLSLRVLGRRADGYHELVSLVAFAGTGDRLSLEPGPLGLTVGGPNAAEAGAEADNLVLRAATALAAKVPGLASGHFHLVKHLPVAAGLGGGSADAAAALRLLARLNGLAADDPRLREAALETGSDIPACLNGTACLMTGRGEGVAPVTLPRFGMVLVNPRVPVSTAAVFRLLALQPGEVRASVPGPPPADRGELLAFLQGEPNDLEPPAHRLAPVLADVAGALEATPGHRLVRMSGSGATMFALYDDCRAAARAARLVKATYPVWWVKPTVLG
ncbi:4-(cytidine 5'-diphospho)-2-C-methyl-D-erythritol kinase [Starkeya sp. ORNL1]|uniref:4-(cytidine 5'-diphospho)-2-C-methyl-D-erythritol kinase n=1 Tax=Starkeya sp. ORNL1 TaxID=2709380 RepID=UPI0014647B1B|nr:4-(cytidine 5'-diphospho)-2-C-methyl-D-erythritol kinase [Starkeya sp. ORNL1]QJP15353.1 4-(cytidine 5'-diphospho)-2-C-methyl-D-erythritol kinase [Starkeya sp. ORNL1]